MASPYLVFSELQNLASIGGFATTAALSNLSAVFLLSACDYLQEQWLWQSPLLKIDDNTYNEILSMIAQAEYEIMANMMIGSIVPSVSGAPEYNLLPLDGSVVAQADYLALSAVVPAAWLVGSDIQLPDMSDSGLFGLNGNSLGSVQGENEHTLDVSEIPSHNHTQNPHSHSYTQTSAIPTAAGIEPTFADLTTQFPSATGLTTATNNPEGGGMAHNNVQKSLSVNWFIVCR